MIEDLIRGAFKMTIKELVDIFLKIMAIQWQSKKNLQKKFVFGSTLPGPAGDQGIVAMYNVVIV